MLPVRSRGSVLAVLACLAIASARCAAPPPREAADERAVRNYLKVSSASGVPLILAEGSTVTAFEIMTITPDGESVTPRDVSQALERSRAEAEALTQRLLTQPATAPAGGAPLRQQLADVAQRELDLSVKLATIDRSLVVDDPTSWPQRIDIIREHLRVDAQVKGTDGAIVKHDLSLTLARVDRGDGLSLPGEWVVEDARDMTRGLAKSAGPVAPALGSLIMVVNEMAHATASWSAPASMTVDSVSDVRLDVASMSTGLTEGLANIVRALSSPDATADSGRLTIAPRLEAVVDSQGFTINAVMPEGIPANPLQQSEWHWQVTPTDGGAMHLHVSLMLVAVLNGVETPYLVRSFDQAVTVRMTASHWIRAFLAEYWQWVVVALALLVLLVRWIPRRSNAPK